MLVENYSLVAVNSLFDCADNFFKLRALAEDFTKNIKFSTFFPHVKRDGNIPTHLLARIGLHFDVALEWTRGIPHDVSRVILFYLNKI